MQKEVGFVMGRRYYESASNRLIVATTGSGMNMLMSKPDYYDFVIIDEIHEQSEMIVQTMALAFELQKQYHFKIILMSATVEESVIAGKPDAVRFEMAP